MNLKYEYSLDNDVVELTIPNSGSISIKDNRDGDSYSIFCGYIKNKSELHRLMKQLDII